MGNKIYNFVPLFINVSGEKYILKKHLGKLAEWGEIPVEDKKGLEEKKCFLTLDGDKEFRGERYHDL